MYRMCWSYIQKCDIFPWCRPRPTYRLFYTRGTRAGWKKQRRIRTLLDHRPVPISNASINISNLIQINILTAPSVRKSTLATLNARSVANKIEHIRHAVVEEQIDILAITETWFTDNSTYEARSLTPDGYTLIRRDRQTRKGGGTALLCHDSFKPRNVKLPDYESLECCMAELSSSTNTIRVLSLYRPPQFSVPLFERDFTSLLESHCLSGPPIVLLGDINIHINNADNAYTRKYIELLASFNMVQHVNEPTHEKGHTLDHIISRNSDSLRISDVEVGECISDHSLVKCKISFPKVTVPKRKVRFRKYNDIKLEDFRTDLTTIPLQENYLNLELSSLVSEFDSQLRNVMERHAPLVEKCTVTQPRQPWYNVDIQQQRRTCRQKERAYRKSNTVTAKDAFLQQRDVYKNALRRAKSDYLSAFVKENAYNQKAIFKSVNKVLRRETPNPMPACESDSILAKEFLQFFTTKVNTIREKFTTGTDQAHVLDTTYTDMDNSEQVWFTRFETLSEQQVLKIINNANTTTCELDPIPTILLKECIDVLLPVITRIVNLSLTESTMPAVYKKAIIRPLLKKPSLDPILRNYRPISNLSFISKVIERAAGNQLTKHMQDHCLDEVNQSAYKPKHSTETGLVMIFDSILHQLDSGNAVFLALLDLSAAFDTVDHQILLERLRRSVRVSGDALRWFVSYLSDRTVRVCIGSDYSDEEQVTCSVPQGSILGPRQYSIYTNPLANLIRILLLLFHMYADDTQVWKSFNPRCIYSQLSATTSVEMGIRNISEWMFNNKLKLNREKTEFLVIASSRSFPLITTKELHLDNETVKSSKSVRNLGVVMDSHLTMITHVNNIRKTGYYYLSWIRKVRHLLSEDITKTIVHALVINRIDYCNSVLVNLPDCAIDGLQKLMNAAARVITRVPQSDHITPVLKALHWLPVRERINFKVLTITFKALNGNAPSYITDLLTEYTPSRSLRSATVKRLVLPRSRLRYGDRRFSVAAPRLWNALPESVKNAPSIVVFKKLLKTHLFRSAYGCEALSGTA